MEERGGSLGRGNKNDRRRLRGMKAGEYRSKTLGEAEPHVITCDFIWDLDTKNAGGGVKGDGGCVIEP